MEDPVMSRIRAYAAEVKSEEQHDAFTTRAASSEAYEQRLDRTLQSLQERLSQQRVELDQIRAATTGPALSKDRADKREQLRQLRSVKAAFDALSRSEPTLPASESALPAVLALRTLQRTTAGTKDAISTTRRDLVSTRLHLQREQAALADSQAIKTALHARISVLQESATARAGQDPTQAAKEHIASKQAKKLQYERETLRLHDALVRFTHEHLSAMIAAEELGGPVVGSEPSAAGGDLTEGFAKSKKRKAGQSDDSARQRRIDDIWSGGDQGGRSHAHNHTDGSMSEQKAAASEVHSLIERLVQALIGASGDGVYVRLERDSATARFLVRTKIAQYHPKDARRLCLVDFGRDLDD